MLFNHENEENPAICNTTDEPRGHYAVKARERKEKYCMMSLMYRILKKKKKKVQLTETESGMVVTRSWEVWR